MRARCSIATVRACMVDQVSCLLMELAELWAAAALVPNFREITRNDFVRHHGSKRGARELPDECPVGDVHAAAAERNRNVPLTSQQLGRGLLPGLRSAGAPCRGWAGADSSTTLAPPTASHDESRPAGPGTWSIST
jgi:hypothetical protein